LGEYKYIRSLSKLGVRGGVGNTAGVSFLNSDVSLFSPRGSPGVFDDPGIRSVSDEGNSVVKLVRAVRENSGIVELEVVGINSDGDGLSNNGGGELVGITLGNVFVSGDLEVSSVDLAFLVSGNVFVFVFAGNSVFFNVFEGLVHKSSIASLISLGR